jgi:hypothetical protein
VSSPLSPTGSGFHLVLAVRGSCDRGLLPVCPVPDNVLDSETGSTSLPCVVRDAGKPQGALTLLSSCRALFMTCV